MKRFRKILLGLVVLGAAETATAMPLGVRMALWNRSARNVQTYSIGEVLGGTWMTGTNGTASAKGYDDATAAGGKSVKFSAADDSVVWIETVFTNACHVSFDWKCSCEELVKGRPYDYMAFEVDGAQRDFICGETDWTNMTILVTGADEHHLRWTFLRDEDGSSGGDCAWLANVTVGEVPPETLGECLNWPGQTFTTGGHAPWTRVQGVSADGYALRSGAITHCQTSRLDTVVSGPGTISFSCRVEGEIVKRVVYDGLAFCIDGVQQGDLMGNTEWATTTFVVAGNGSHTLSWLYVKDDEGNGSGADCAWLDAVTWVPTGAVGVIVDVGDGKSVTVPDAWFTDRGLGANNVVANSAAANGRKVWECYVLGLDPKVETNDFRIVSFPMKADGTPDLAGIVFEPPQAQWNVPATYKVKGAAALAGPWGDVPAGGNPAYRFFKIEVEVP